MKLAAGECDPEARANLPTPGINEKIGSEKRALRQEKKDGVGYTSDDQPHEGTN